MNADQAAVYKLLQERPETFVPAVEISRRLGAKRKFLKDRTWAQPILRRMEIDGLLETNECGEYRIKPSQDDIKPFKTALNDPAAALGDTTLISLDDVAAKEKEEQENLFGAEGSDL